MAVKEIKCQDMNASWINSSFMDSFCLKSDADEEEASKTERADEEIVSENKRPRLSDENEVAVRSSGSARNGGGIKRIWSEKYKPKCMDDLVVNKKKVLEVEMWLKDVWKQNLGKTLLITGPTGCGKTSTLNVVCRSLGIGIVEWATPLDIAQEKELYGSFVQHKNVVQMFEEFLLSATKYSSLLSYGPSKRLILIKDIPSNFLDKPSLFHEIVRRYATPRDISPVVFIISCESIGRDLFPDDLKFQLKMSNINFNPVIERALLKALNQVIMSEAKVNSGVKAPPKPDLVDICQSSDGDLRSALLKLQFGLDSGGGGRVFKVPTMDSNNRRTRVKKTTSKRTGTTHTVNEIDKDKKLDFFHSVGRVLYPKKNIDEKDPKKYTFVHSPGTIVGTFLTEPNKLVNILHENYLERFSDIKDVCVASEKLTTTDLLFAPWEGKDVLIEYGLSIAVRGLMTSNTRPTDSRWRPLSKSRIYVTETGRRQNIDSTRVIFPDLQSAKDVLLDTIPYLTKLNVKLPPEKDVIVKNLVTFKNS